MATSTPTKQSTVEFELRGGNRDFWIARDSEILVEGPRGTGKTRTILEKLNALCHEHPGLAVLVTRKYQRSLAQSCLKTFRDHVVKNGDGVKFFGGNDEEPAAYRYKNGSTIVIGGMDDPEKVKSSEYSIVYVNEATELTEEDWESLLPILRQVGKNGERLIQYRRLIGDCNPTDAGNWLNQRCEKGLTRRIRTSLRDNPLYYDSDGNILEEGEQYLSKMGTLTGSRRERWIDGLWTGTENACYPMFDRTVHIQPIPDGLYFQATIIGEDYGSKHECAVAAISIDQYNRRWVREVWGQPDDDEGYSLNLTVSQFKERYRTRRGRGDPNQKYLNDTHGFKTASGASGSRLHRVDLLQRLFYSYPGGRVPTYTQEMNLSLSSGPYAEPDSPGIYLVEGAPGIDKLVSQIDAYHYIFTETPAGVSKSVYRDNDDFIAAVEYANEEWEEGLPAGGIPSALTIPGIPQFGQPKSTPRRKSSGKHWSRIN